LELTDCEISIIKEERVHVKVHVCAVYDTEPIWHSFIHHKVNNVVAAEILTDASQKICRPAEGSNLGGIQSKEFNLNAIRVTSHGDMVVNTGSVELTMISSCSLQDPSNVFRFWLYLIRKKVVTILSHSLICELDDKNVFG
jgi:hypothetical protein